MQCRRTGHSCHALHTGPQLTLLWPRAVGATHAGASDHWAGRGRRSKIAHMTLDDRGPKAKLTNAMTKAPGQSPARAPLPSAPMFGAMQSHSRLCAVTVPSAKTPPVPICLGRVLFSREPRKDAGGVHRPTQPPLSCGRCCELMITRLLQRRGPERIGRPLQRALHLSLFCSLFFVSSPCAFSPLHAFPSSAFLSTTHAAAHLGHHCAPAPLSLCRVRQ